MYFIIVSEYAWSVRNIDSTHLFIFDNIDKLIKPWLDDVAYFIPEYENVIKNK